MNRTTETPDTGRRLSRYRNRSPWRYVVAAVILLAVATYHLVPMIVSTERVTDQLKEDLTAVIGAPVTISGDTHISYWPRPEITISGVSAPQPPGRGPLVYGSIQTLTARFSLLKALTGETAFTDVTLESPTIILEETGESGGPAHSRLSKALTVSAAAGSGFRMTGVSSLSILDGTLGLSRDDDTKVIKGVNGTFSWPQLGGPMTFNGTATLNEQISDISATIDKPLELNRETASPVKLSLKNSLAEMTYEGTATRSAPYLMDGSFSFSTANTHQLGDWIDVPVLVLEDVNRLAIKGTVTRSSGSLRFSPATLSLGGSEGKGVVDLAPASEKQPLKMIATLAFGDITLSNIRSSLPAWIDAVSATPDEFSDEDWKLPALDLRLSASTVKLSDVTLEDVAASVMRSKTQTSFDIADSRLGSGTLFAHIGVQKNMAAEVDISAEKVAAEPFFRQLGFNVPLTSDSLDFDMAVDAELPFSRIAAENTTGDVRFTARGGSLAWLDFATLIEKAGTDNTFLLTYPGDTAFSFTRLKGDATLSGTELDLNDLIIETETDMISLTGSLDTQSGQLDATATITSKVDENATPASVSIIGNPLASLVRRIDPVSDEASDAP